MKVTKEELYNRLYNKFTNEKEYIKIIDYSNMNKQASFECLKCGYNFNCQPRALLTRHSNVFCINCHNPHMGREKTKKNLLEIDEIFLNDNSITKIWVGFKSKKESNHPRLAVKFLCNKCKKENEIFYQDLKYKKFKCRYCEKGTHYTAEEFDDWLKENYNEKFKMLDYAEYKDNTSRIHIRCNDCNFIFYPTVASLKRDKKVLCPKCKQGKSRAELYIGDWLSKHEIDYATEVHFNWLSKPFLRYDFVIEKYKLIIEFMGEQHYKFVPHFHSTLERFNLLKENDLLKEKECKNNGYNYLAIPYTYENKLNRILNNLFGSTTIPRGSRGKSLEIDSIYLLDEDIV